MSRPRLALSFTLAGSTALAVLACSGGATLTPSTVIPTVAIPSVAIPSVAIPSISMPSVVIPSISIPPLPSGLPSISIPPLPSGLPSALPSIVFPHDAPDLENVLPNQIRGVTLQKVSYSGTTFLGGSTDPTFANVLAGLGKTPADLAAAGALDTSGTLKFTLLAFRLAGVDATKLVAAVLAADTDKPTITTASIGGKNVTISTDADGDKSYIYTNGEVAFTVDSDADDADALIAEILTALP